MMPSLSLSRWALKSAEPLSEAAAERREAERRSALGWRCGRHEVGGARGERPSKGANAAGAATCDLWPMAYGRYMDMI